jgi:hypothetical protein
MVSQCFDREDHRKAVKASGWWAVRRRENAPVFISSCREDACLYFDRRALKKFVLLAAHNLSKLEKRSRGCQWQ